MNSWLMGFQPYFMENLHTMGLGGQRTLTTVFTSKEYLHFNVLSETATLDMRSSEIRLRKLKLTLRDKRFVNHKAPWQQPLQSVLILRGFIATDLFITIHITFYSVAHCRTACNIYSGLLLPMLRRHTQYTLR